MKLSATPCTDPSRTNTLISPRTHTQEDKRWSPIDTCVNRTTLAQESKTDNHNARSEPHSETNSWMLLRCSQLPFDPCPSRESFRSDENTSFATTSKKDGDIDAGNVNLVQTEHPTELVKRVPPRHAPPAPQPPNPPTPQPLSPPSQRTQKPLELRRNRRVEVPTTSRTQTRVENHILNMPHVSPYALVRVS